MAADEQQYLTGTLTQFSTTKGGREGRLASHLLGFLAVAVFPAAFWTGVLYAVAYYVGNPPGLLIIGGFFGIVLAFLSIIFASVIDSGERD